jgi:hypothetical protein
LLKRVDYTVIPTVIFSADEVSAAIAERVSAFLVKSQTSNQVLLRAISTAIDRVPQPGETGGPPA